MGIDEKLREEIIQRVTSVSRPDRIILFGSAATGGMTRDSDIDLLIIKTKLANPREERRQIRESLRSLGYPFDILLMTMEHFEESKNVIGGIAYPASKYGRVIYEAA
ncbi:MAG: hypothetical protein A2V67_15730 [Deltaproteobacteria bacterium RBG_13_61_14]|nr:MAG: hypothetical protein A2V67_15730 [Deltaproteobacteria bacterium RBG_13_61_14]